MKRIMFALGLALSVAATPALAHHSFDGTFDRNKMVKLNGSVTEFRFANPHSVIVLAVAGADGKKQEWLIETTSAGSLASNGWTAHSLTAGEQLEVEGWAARNGTHYARLSSMRHTDGRPVSLWLPPGPGPLPGA